MQVSLLILFLICLPYITPQSRMKEIVRRISLQVGQVEQEILKSPKMSLKHVKKIAGRGFKYYSDVVERIYYRGIGTDPDNFNNFFDVILEGVQILKEDKDFIKSAISPIAFTAAIDFKNYDVIFDKNAKNNSGGFFTFLVEKKDPLADRFDILLLSIKNRFELAPDIFIMTKGSGNFFFSTTKQYLKKRNRSLSHEEYGFLIAYFQVAAFKNTDKLMAIVDNL